MSSAKPNLIYSVTPQSESEVVANWTLLQDFAVETRKSLSSLQRSVKECSNLALQAQQLAETTSKQIAKLSSQLEDISLTQSSAEESMGKLLVLEKGLRELRRAVQEPGAAPRSASSIQLPTDESIEDPVLHGDTNKGTLVSQLKVPKLSTYTGREDPELWIRGVEETFAALEIPAARFHSLIPRLVLHLADGAKEWWYSTWGKEGSALPSSWDLFKKEFIAAHGNPTKVQEARDKLVSIRQTSSVSSYLTYFRSLVRQIPDLQESESYHIFKRGLKPSIKQRILEFEAIFGKTLDFSAMVSLALQMESIHGSSSSTISPGKTSSPECYKCGLPGHKAKNCKTPVSQYKKKEDSK